MGATYLRPAATPGGSFDGVHNDLNGRSSTGAHPISAITDLLPALTDFANAIQAVQGDISDLQTDLAAAVSALDGKLDTTAGGKDAVASLGSMTGGVTVNLTNGNSFYGTLTGNVTSVTLSNATSGKECEFVLEITQDSTPRTITWGSAWKWAGGTPPTLSTASGAKDIIVARTRDGGTTIHAAIVGQAFS